MRAAETGQSGLVEDGFDEGGSLTTRVFDAVIRNETPHDIDGIGIAGADERNQFAGARLFIRLECAESIIIAVPFNRFALGFLSPFGPLGFKLERLIWIENLNALQRRVAPDWNRRPVQVITQGLVRADTRSGPYLILDHFLQV